MVRKCLQIFSVITLTVMLLIPNVAWAESSIDTSKVSSGYVTVQYDGDVSRGIAVLVQKGGDKYQYVLKVNKTSIPLQMGDGSYKVTLLEKVGGDKYKPVATESVSVSSINEKEMYTVSHPIVNYSVSTKAIPAYKAMVGGKGESAQVKTVYEDIVKNYRYDFAKASSVSNGYVPVIDTMYTAKKGICYDYSALLAGVLRSQGIPTKLVMGYAPEISEYHAWNEVFIDGKWTVVDTTYDAQMEDNGQKYSFAKDKSKYKVVKQY